ncbi:MAG: UDP-N-acetylmuramate--L-alanine ligase [Chloroflexi bacterium]|nr:UDP-N-acetylmuramate--L-alanine ligase [Chloroflexota bacterium]
MCEALDPWGTAAVLPGQHIHFIGIGGFGLSAIARVLLQKGYVISGSDRARSPLTEALARDGVQIDIGHEPAYVVGADLVIRSSAVSDDHVEVLAARAANIPVYKRADVLAAIMAGQAGIAVAGTHGKTTTTAMITHILIETGRDPSYIIGGVLRSTGLNAAFGSGPAFVIEADEYDHMFHGLRPQVAVITNIEWDHPDFFPTPDALFESFAAFLDHLPDDGLLIACADSPQAAQLAAQRSARNCPTETYSGAQVDAAWTALDVRAAGPGMTFTVGRRGEPIALARLLIPGLHNVANALAALAVAHQQGVAVEAAVAALATFSGTGRRFEVRGEVGGVTVVDDYAHHPTAIRATLAAARARYPDHALWVVWQPHTFSRTAALFDSFVTAFADADYLLVTDIYAAREDPLPGVDSRALVAALSHPNARHTPARADCTAVLLAEVSAPAVILIMSAGDAPQIGADFLAQRAEIDP